MKKVDYIYQTVKNPHFVKNPGESAGFFKKTQKNPPGPGFFKILAGFANPAKDHRYIRGIIGFNDALSTN